MGNLQKSELAAKRWAKALMELAQEDSNISKSDILEDLREVAMNINASDELSNVINNPSIPTEEKQIVICKLFQNKVMPVVYNFLYVLNLRKRLNIIDEIADWFEKELEDLNNIVRVSVTSAIDMDEERKKSLKAKISSKLNKDIIVNWEVEPDIIAGLVMNINETVVDNSIKHKLEVLSKDIIQGA